MRGRSRTRALAGALGRARSRLRTRMQRPCPPSDRECVAGTRGLQAPNAITASATCRSRARRERSSYSACLCKHSTMMPQLQRPGGVRVRRLPPFCGRPACLPGARPLRSTRSARPAVHTLASCQLLAACTRARSLVSAVSAGHAHERRSAFRGRSAAPHSPRHNCNRLAPSTAASGHSPSLRGRWTRRAAHAPRPVLPQPRLQRGTPRCRPACVRVRVRAL